MCLIQILVKHPKGSAYLSSHRAGIVADGPNPGDLRQGVAEGQIRGALPATGSGRPSWASIDLHVRPAGPAGTDGVFELVGDADVITDPNELYSRLAARRAVLSEEATVTIRPVWSVRWQHVVEAFNQTVRADFQNVNIAPSRTE